MPGSIVAANPSAVMPFSLCTAFHHERYYAVDENSYENGEVQRSALVETSRKKWVLAKHLTSAEWSELLAFFNSQKGGTVEFIFYDVWETDPLFNYDETGTAEDGKYAVRFDGPWQEALVHGSMVDAQLSLIEVS